MFLVLLLACRTASYLGNRKIKSLKKKIEKLFSSFCRPYLQSLCSGVVSRLCVGDSISSAVQIDDMGRWNRSLKAQRMDVQGDAIMSRAQVHSSNFSP